MDPEDFDPVCKDFGAVCETFVHMEPECEDFGAACETLVRSVAGARKKQRSIVAEERIAKIEALNMERKIEALNQIITRLQSEIAAATDIEVVKSEVTRLQMEDLSTQIEFWRDLFNQIRQLFNQIR